MSQVQWKAFERAMVWKNWYIYLIWMNCAGSLIKRSCWTRLAYISTLGGFFWAGVDKQGFIQAVLLMSVFWTKTEFSNVVDGRWGRQGAVSSAADSYRSLSGGSWGKSHERFWPFYIWEQMNSLR